MCLSFVSCFLGDVASSQVILSHNCVVSPPFSCHPLWFQCDCVPHLQELAKVCFLMFASRCLFIQSSSQIDIYTNTYTHTHENTEDIAERAVQRLIRSLNTFPFFFLFFFFLDHPYTRVMTSALLDPSSANPHAVIRCLQIFSLVYLLTCGWSCSCIKSCYTKYIHLCSLVK